MSTTETIAGKITARRPSGVALGHLERRHTAGRKIAITFDDETFGQLQAMAVRRQVSFGSVVRELVDFGLLDIEEGRRDAR